MTKGAISLQQQSEFYDVFWRKQRRLMDRVQCFYYSDEKSRERLLQHLLRIHGQRFPCGGRGFDLGCGRGRVASWLATRGWRMSGLDLSPATIATNTQRYPDIEFVSGDLLAYPHYQFGIYDLVVSLEVMEHLVPEQRSNYAQVISRLLKTDGVAIISTPNAFTVRRLGLPSDQPLDFWMEPDEFRSYFEEEFVVLDYCTAALCWRNRAANFLWKLTPLVNAWADKYIRHTGKGKYQMLMLQKRRSSAGER
ncbi:MAG: class I SAM-dependent methyltransferase [Deltaproteobacteria bacterium]|nr:class I SAM-dependent methyltransferase [Deltaproteobacteria bacterium]